ncbi:hypothetical protein M0805_002596 [Coniferiporia weirii]|nr:hypothetical protein M0805_002596 [Coniferiporia weirii]
MYRQATRRDEARSSTQGDMPLGRTSTEANQGSEKRSRSTKGPRTRPLAPSTDCSTPGPAAEVLPRSTRSEAYGAQVYRRMGRSPTPMPLDKDDDWTNDQSAPPVPLVADSGRTRSRMRASSTGGLKSRAKSEERKSTFVHHPQDASRPPSRHATSSRVSPAVPQDESHWADDDYEEYGLQKKRSTATYTSQDSKFSQDTCADGFVSATRSGSTAHTNNLNASLRKHPWGKSKATSEETAPQESAGRRTSQLGLRELEKDSFAGSRDAVHKVTRQSTPEAQRSPVSLHYNTPNICGTLSPPSTYSGALSPRSSNSPRLLESTPVMDRYRNRNRSKNVPDTSSTKLPSRARSPLLDPPEHATTYLTSNAACDSRYMESVQANHDDASLRQHPRNRMTPGLKPKSILKASLDTRQPASRQVYSRGQDLDTDDSALEYTLRTPRARSSSRTQTSPLLSVSSPSEKSSNIPSPRLKSQPSLSALRSAKSSYQSAGCKSPSLLVHSSPVPTDSRHDGTPRSPCSAQTGQIGPRIRSNSKSNTSGSPTISKEGKRVSHHEGTPKASYATWNKTTEHESDDQPINNINERLMTTERSLGLPPHRTAPTHLSPQPDSDRARLSPRSATPPTRKRSPVLTCLNPDQSGSDLSEHVLVHSDKASEDSHIRRKNELVDLVAGLNLDLGPQESERSTSSAYSFVRETSYLRHGHTKPNVAGEYPGTPCDAHPNVDGILSSDSSINNASGDSLACSDETKVSPRRRSYISCPREDVRQDSPPSRRASSLKRLSAVIKPTDGDVTIDAIRANASLKPDADSIKRDSLLMLNAERQREAFGIPPSVSDVREGIEAFSSAESSMSIRNPALDSEMEGEVDNTLGLSLGAEKLFHSLGIGAEARQTDDTALRVHRTSWRSSMAEAEKYIMEPPRPSQAPMSASSSSSSIYEDDVPDRPWQKRERDLDRIQSAGGSSIKSSWRKMLSRSAYVSLLERHGEEEMRRQEVIWELCETEQAFLKSLRIVLKVFVHPLLLKNRTWVAGLPSNVSRLLDWLDDIFQLHAQISSALQHARSSQYPVVLRIAETLRTFVPKLEVYQPYIVRLDEVVDEIEVMMKDPKNDLGEFFRIQSASEEIAGMTFCSFLWLPLTRLGRYLKHFNELWLLTPGSHVDHLPTFSLLHSATTVVRVMREVKLREEEYMFVKDLISRVRGLPNNVQLARRERRLVAHGALQRVHLSERCKDILEGNFTAAPPQRNHRVGVSGHRADLRHRRRANSLDSCLTSELSDATSMTSVCSSTSNLSIAGEDVRSFSKAVSGDSKPTSDKRHSKQRPAQDAKGILLREKTRTTPLYAFIFTDLALFAVPISPRPNGSGRDAWELLDDVGICRVLSVTDNSGHLGYDHLTTLHVLPMDTEQLESGVPSDASAMSLFVHIPKNMSAGQKHQDARKRWWDAFEQCYLFTLRSLSFPAHSGRYLTHGPGFNAEQEVNTRQTVMSILASGLPLPRSPSVQIKEFDEEDAAVKEREERGWWALRFQQILCEMQRDPTLSLQKSPSLPPALPVRKTVSGRRRLKLGVGKK